MRQFKSGFSFIMPDETGFFYSLIILYTILGQNSSFRNREVNVGKMKILFRKENVPGPPRFNTLKC